MSGPFQEKRVVLGVTGSIAIYKAVDLASKLTQAGARVDVLMTRSAREFVTPLTFRSVTHRPVVADLFDAGSPDAVEHVAIAKQADILVVAPATANILAKLAGGFADDPITVTALATVAPVLVAPAMDAGMWDHPAVQTNVQALRARGVAFAEPAKGHLASGLEGWGRLVETPELMGHIALVLGRNGDLAGRRIVVSAGGTHEPIDPVRVVANRSSGKMGYAVAEAARERGAQAVLVSSATALAAPVGVEVVSVGTAEEMLDAVEKACDGADALVMAAAVADYRPKKRAAQKVKKTATAWSLELDQVPERVFKTSPDLIHVGFAAESNDLLKNAKAKLDQKHIDLIAANDITKDGSGFGADTNKVTLLDPEGGVEELPLLPKYDVAWRLLDRVRDLLALKRERAHR